MKSGITILLALFAASMLSAAADAQTSSLGGRIRKEEAKKPPAARAKADEEERAGASSIVERYSWIAVKPPPPRSFKVHDQITVIVREQRTYEANAETSTEKGFGVKSDLEAFFKPTAGGLGSAAFRRGQPNVDYKYEHSHEGEADSKREDRLTTRVQAEIIDVKPNGVLVIEARKRIEHDEEVSIITLTGACRKQDITADNTILSTQLADANIRVENPEGSLRENTRRGWIPKLLDALRPF